MTTPKESLRLTLMLALSSAVAMSVACSDRRTTGGGSTTKNKDATVAQDSSTTLDTGFPPHDAGTTVDTGPIGCGHNPNNCVLHQIIGSSPNCECTPNCEVGYIYVAGPPVRCDVDSNHDAGTIIDTGVVDSGIHPDGGTTTPDSGIQACQTNNDCTEGNTPTCIYYDSSTDLLSQCAGQTDCECIDACTPNVSPSNCPTNQTCFWWFYNLSGITGFCVDDTGGGTQAQSCNATFDPGGNLTGHSCNSAQNYYCLGAAADNPVGVCAKICPGTPDVCSGLGNYTCDIGVGQDVGLCTEPPPIYTDMGAACQAPTECQSNNCGTQFGGFCVSDCAGLASCPTNAICVSFGTGGPAPTCILECTTGGTALCEGVNTTLACQHFFADPATGICMPKCAQPDDCPTGMTCNTTTGECQ